MHVSLDLDVSPTSRLPAGQWFMIRAGVREADPGESYSLTQEPIEETQREPRQTLWFFVRFLSKEKSEHLDHHSYMLRIPRRAAANDLSSILLVDLLIQGIVSNEYTSYDQPWEQHADSSDAALLGRYRVSLVDLLGSRGQSQTVSIMSLIEDSKLADLTVQYQLFTGAKMDRYVIVTMDRPGEKGYLSLCACVKEAGYVSYYVVYQDITSGAKTGPIFELAIPYDVLLCYSSVYGLTIADKGETDIPASSVIGRMELKKLGLDLLSSSRDSQASIRLPSNSSLSTPHKQRRSAIGLRYIGKQSEVDQILYIVIDDSLSMRFECLKVGISANVRTLIQTILKTTSQLVNDNEMGKDKCTDPLPIIPWMEIPISGAKWSLKEAVEALQSHISDSNAFVRNSGLSERPFGRPSYDPVISKGIYVLALSNDALHATILHACISECNSVVFLLFCFLDQNAEASKLLARHSNVIIFDILRPNYTQLQHVLLSICGCIRYSAESGKRRQCICSYHAK